MKHKAPVIAIIILSLLYLWRLSSPAFTYGDEGFYVGAAKSILQTGSDINLASHPPVGKLLIAAGMILFGDTPFGWRISSVLFGIIGLIAIYHITLRLTKNRRYAFTSILLLGLNPFWIIHSRLAMLEVFVSVWLLLSIWTLIAKDKPSNIRIMITGIFLGLAIATKWVALFALPVFIVYLIKLQSDWLWKLDWLKNIKKVFNPSILKNLLFCLAPIVIFVASALIIYGSSYFLSSPSLSLQTLLHIQLEILGGNLQQFKEVATWSSGPFEWLFGWKPIWYAYQLDPNSLKGVLLLQHPVLLLSQGALIVFGIKYRRQLQNQSNVLIFLLMISFFCGWLIIERHKFIYYLTPFIPLYIISLLLVFEHVQVKAIKKIALIAYIIISLLSWPLYTNQKTPLQIEKYLPLTKQAQSFFQVSTKTP